MTIAKCYENGRSSPLAVELNDAPAQILAKLVEARNLKDGDILIRGGGNELQVTLPRAVENLP